MIKKILAFSLTLNIILTGVTAFAVPSVDYMFHDDETDRYYVFGAFDKADGVPEDAGIYFKGLKYKYTHLEEEIEKDNPKFGISFSAPPEYMEIFRVKPYITLADKKEIVGKQKSYDKEEDNGLKDDFVFYENFDDFDIYGEEPWQLTCVTNTYTEAVVDMVEIDNAFTQVLRLTDNSTTQIATATCELPEYTENLTFEAKIKMNKTDTDGYGFIIDFLDENEKRAFRIVKYSNATSGLSFVNSSGNTTFTAGVDMNDEWFTLKLFMDSNRKYSSLAIENDIYNEENFDLSEHNFVWQDKDEGRIIAYNLPWYNEYNAGNNIKYIKFSTYGNTAGEYLIDDINIYTNGEDYRPKRTRADSKPIRVIADPD